MLILSSSCGIVVTPRQKPVEGPSEKRLGQCQLLLESWRDSEGRQSGESGDLLNCGTELGIVVSKQSLEGWRNFSEAVRKEEEVSVFALSSVVGQDCSKDQSKCLILLGGEVEGDQGGEPHTLWRCTLMLHPSSNSQEGDKLECQGGGVTLNVEMGLDPLRKWANLNRLPDQTRPFENMVVTGLIQHREGDIPKKIRVFAFVQTIQASLSGAPPEGRKNPEDP